VQSSQDLRFGVLVLETLNVFGDPGPHDDWIIAASAATPLAARNWANEASDARDDAVAAATEVSGDATQVAADRVAVANDRTTVSTLTSQVSSNASLAQAALDQAEDILDELQTIQGTIDPAGISTQISDLQSQKAPLASPALTGTPTAPTAALGTNTTQIATAAFVQAALNALKGAASAGFDTLGEIEAAIASLQAGTAALNALGALTPANSQFNVPVFDSATHASLQQATAYGLSLLALSGSPALRAAIGADDASNLTTGTLNAALLPDIPSDKLPAQASTVNGLKTQWMTTY